MILTALKLIDIPDEELEKAYPEILEMADQMVRANVHFTGQDFALMHPLERRALAEAGDRLRKEGALMTAGAVGNPEYQRKLLGDVYGEEVGKDHDRTVALATLLTRAHALMDETKKRMVG